VAQHLAFRLGGVCEAPTDARKARESFRRKFRRYDQWIFIGAAGIATRYLSGLPRDKKNDPCVVVLDDACHHAVPILGGHEAGGNELACRIARETGACPVITTASEACKPLVLGIGCRKGIAPGAVDEAVRAAVESVGHAVSDIREAATVEIKKDEPGLLEWCRANRVPLRIFSVAVLAGRAWVSKPSAWVQKNIGLPGVCEPCALLASPQGTVVVPKMAVNGVAVCLVKNQKAQQF